MGVTRRTMEQDLSKIKEYLKKPRTIPDIKKHMSYTNVRTVYRRFSDIEKDEESSLVRVGSSRPTQYQITE